MKTMYFVMAAETERHAENYLMDRYGEYAENAFGSEEDEEVVCCTKLESVALDAFQNRHPSVYYDGGKVYSENIRLYKLDFDEDEYDEDDVDELAGIIDEGTVIKYKDTPIIYMDGEYKAYDSSNDSHVIRKYLVHDYQAENDAAALMAAYKKVFADLSEHSKRVYPDPEDIMDDSGELDPDFVDKASDGYISAELLAAIRTNRKDGE